MNDEQKMNDEKTEEEEDIDDITGSNWHLRNTDSLYSELSELSREYVESVDQGASVRGMLCTKKEKEIHVTLNEMTISSHQ